MESQLEHDLYFTHRFNTHKLMGLLIDDNDIESIARVYGVPAKELAEIQKTFDDKIDAGVNELKSAFPSFGKSIRAIGIGDSITSDRTSWAKILNAFFKPSGGYVIDAGISGDTTSDVINRFYSSVLCHDFDWAVIFIGTNDCRGLEDEYHMNNTGLAEYQNNLTYITKVLVERYKKVINVTIPPVDPVRLASYFGEQNNWTYSEKRIGETNDFIRAMSRTLGTRLADLAEAIRVSGSDPLEEDGIHINDSAQRLAGRLILQEMLA